MNGSVNIWYLLGAAAGVLAGLAVVAVVCTLLRKKGTGKSCQYDERQQFARGKAYQAGFFTMLVYELLYGMADAAGLRWCANVTGIVIGAILGIGVFAVTAISRDAYMALNERMKSWLILCGALIAVNGLATVRYALEGELIRDGMLTENWMNPLSVALFLAILVAQLVHWLQGRRGETEDAE